LLSPTSNLLSSIFRKIKATMTLENPNYGNGIMLKLTLAKMTKNTLGKALKPSNIISSFKTTCMIYSTLSWNMP